MVRASADRQVLWCSFTGSNGSFRCVRLRAAPCSSRAVRTGQNGPTPTRHPHDSGALPPGVADPTASRDKGVSAEGLAATAGLQPRRASELAPPAVLCPAARRCPRPRRQPTARDRRQTLSPGRQRACPARPSGASAARPKRSVRSRPGTIVGATGAGRAVWVRLT